MSRREPPSTFHNHWDSTRFNCCGSDSANCLTHVLRIAKRENRVIVTLDRDFIEPWLATGIIAHGIIYLELTGPLRYVGSVNTILARFLVHQAPSVNLEKSIVVIRESEVRIDTTD